MIYEAMFAKEKTYWWDEDGSGSCVFAAEDDAAALSFVATVIQRMNRKYQRMGERRDVRVERVSRLEERGFSIEYVDIPLQGISPLKGFRPIRRALEAFYPKESCGRRASIAHMFNDWDPVMAPASRS